MSTQKKKRIKRENLAKNARTVDYVRSLALSVLVLPIEIEGAGGPIINMSPPVEPPINVESTVQEANLDTGSLLTKILYDKNLDPQTLYSSLALSTVRFFYSRLWNILHPYEEIAVPLSQIQMHELKKIAVQDPQIQIRESQIQELARETVHFLRWELAEQGLYPYWALSPYYDDTVVGDSPYWSPSPYADDTAIEAEREVWKKIVELIKPIEEAEADNIAHESESGEKVKNPIDSFGSTVIASSS